MIDVPNSPKPNDPRSADERLERLVHRVLRDQPARHAPHTLESRVLTAIERRVALPWWRSSFMHWPLPARVVFLLASCGVVKLALSALTWLFADLHSTPVTSTLAQPLAWVRATSGFLSSMAALGASIVHAVPSPWLYAGLAFGAALYVALFALGATAYRTLYLRK